MRGFLFPILMHCYTRCFGTNGRSLSTSPLCLVADMMKKRRLWSALATLSLMACVRVVEVDLPEEKPKVVVVGHFTSEEPLRVYLSLSQPLNATTLPPTLSDGDVTLAANGIFLNRLELKPVPDGRLFWHSRDALRTGVRYTITARFPGFETVQASDTIPVGVSRVSMKVKTDSIRILEDTSGLRVMRVPISIRVDDLPTANRYFAFGLQHELRKNQSPPTNTSEFRLSGFLANGRTLALTYGTPEGIYMLNENYWNDARRTLDIEVVIPYRPAEERPVRLLLEWRTLSEAYYRYHLSLATQGSPLSEPNALFNNVQGGYGNFSGFARLRLSANLPE